MSDLRKLIDLDRKRSYVEKVVLKRRSARVQYFGGESECLTFSSKKAVRTARRLLRTSLYTTLFITKELEILEYYDE